MVLVQKSRGWHVLFLGSRFISISTANRWTAQRWRNCFQTHSTTSDSSHTMHSMCLVAWTMKVGIFVLLRKLIYHDQGNGPLSRWYLVVVFVRFLDIVILICISDQAGKGCVYTYDAVGSYERSGYSSQGSGMQLIMPVLDNQLKSSSPLVLPQRVSFHQPPLGFTTACLYVVLFC